MEKQIFYSFIKLELTQFESFEANFMNDDKPFELSNSFKFNYCFEDNVVACITTVTIAKEKAAVLKADLVSYFKILPESADAMIENNCLTLPADLMSQFASLSYGSMRGVIYAKTMGTPLERIILPPADVRGLFTAPAKFKAQS